MENNKFLIPLAIVVAGALVAGAIYFGGKPVEKKSLTGAQNTNTAQDINVKSVTSADHILGSVNSPVVIVEYSDTECPFCKTFHNTMHELVSSYGGKVAWVYRHFPIAQLHSKAPKEAEALECAADQGGNTMFWNYLDKIFAATNSNNSLDSSELPRIANDLGLDVSAFNNCLSSGKHTQEIQDSIKDAITAGAQGTPYSVIIAANGQKDVINGAEPLSSVRTKIDALLR